MSTLLLQNAIIICTLLKVRFLLIEPLKTHKFQFEVNFKSILFCTITCYFFPLFLFPPKKEGGSSKTGFKTL